LLIDAGATEISLADTVGLASPAQIAETLRAVYAAHDGVEIGVHLHARPDQAAECIRAAFDAGCRRFDGAIGGLGGCPFAQDALVGNLATERAIAELQDLGEDLPKLEPLDGIVSASNAIAAKYGPAIQ
jgi:hydroxymethylglutaryl-CoA lyase